MPYFILQCICVDATCYNTVFYEYLLMKFGCLISIFSICTKKNDKKIKLRSVLKMSKYCGTDPPLIFTYATTQIASAI